MRLWEGVANTAFTSRPRHSIFHSICRRPGQTAEETVLYHLINLTWYFRRRVVDRCYERVLQVLTIPERDQAHAAANVYDVLGRELMQVAARAIIRRPRQLAFAREGTGTD